MICYLDGAEITASKHANIHQTRIEYNMTSHTHTHSGYGIRKGRIRQIAHTRITVRVLVLSLSQPGLHYIINIILSV